MTESAESARWIEFHTQIVQAAMENSFSLMASLDPVGIAAGKRKKHQDRGAVLEALIGLSAIDDDVRAMAQEALTDFRRMASKREAMPEDVAKEVRGLWTKIDKCADRSEVAKLLRESQRGLTSDVLAPGISVAEKILVSGGPSIYDPEWPFFKMFGSGGPEAAGGVAKEDAKGAAGGAAQEGLTGGDAEQTAGGAIKGAICYSVAAVVGAIIDGLSGDDDGEVLLFEDIDDIVPPPE